MTSEAETGQGRDEAAPGPGWRRVRGGTGKRRTWGSAAKRAARRSAANGGRTRRRSLKAVRESQMVTQEELADYCSLSRSTIAALEKGRRPQPTTARIIAQMLNVEVTAIAWGREE